ncbi:helix-hairpin-helix domain-containing protein [Pseudomonas putida]|uniref:ComEA family DNA-binding protein n=1 Tax=Pseudomonas putida TaxID=303 RepID=UPI0023649310|nr:helix-hairpin-helix domain-containing protein [Pseudomonas putida]MDD1965628.1 helix-hairpin-helix domain-containing protein [Pseudomonas putida]
MRMSYLSSLVLAVVASFSMAANAQTPAATASPAPATTMAAPAAQSGKVNINTASADVLHKELSGIGAGKAAAIVAYRDENGAFASVDELIEVKGIGKALVDRNREKLALD